MGKFGKWIAGGLGWAIFGPIGGILAFALGSLIEKVDAQSRTGYSMTTTGSFAASLLVLIAAVMKADGRVMKSELNYIKKYFIQTFGEESAAEAIHLLRDLLKQTIPVQSVCLQIKQNLDYSSRLELLHLLLGVAKADGQVDASELNAIALISRYLGISSKDFDSIKSMFVEEVNSAYRILEIESTVSDEEVKKAYRKMALKYHPDKVSHLGEDFQLKAKEKFQRVNEAYEKIKKERGMN
ncbi:MAG: TerB family tellurite resistance protein [Bacteroidales bacterium]|jgi:DnaJ like chaperone protein|nr:TerB family tellurite resistance protein [Bacteroidales bacterium]